MTTIRKREGKWQALVRRHGSRQVAKTFVSLKSAEQWARQMETRLESGVPDHIADIPFQSFADVVRRYEKEVSRQKRGYPVERYRLQTISKSCLGKLSPSQVTGSQIARFRDERLKMAGNATVRRELGLLRHLLEVARLEWGLPYSQNPVDQIQKPQPPQGRSRRLAEGEEEQLIEALKGCLNPEIPLMVRFAIETGMRRGEIVKLQWRDVDFKSRTALLRETKTGQDRTAPLSPAAIAILQAQAVSRRAEGRVFATTASALQQSWQRTLSRSEIADLHFHDLRHEAISRFFERGLSVPEVALISGHKTPAMLFRYTHLKAEAVAEKLRLQK
jgi:integrase